VRGVVAVLTCALALVSCCPPGVAGVDSAPTALAATVDGTTRPTFGADADAAALSNVQERTLHDRFESAWRLVAERYWDLDSLPVDWDEVGDEYRERMSGVGTEEGLYELLEEMYDEIGDDHSVYVRPTRVDDIRQQYGDLPCLAMFDARATVPGAYGTALGSWALEPADVVTDEIGVVAFGMTEGDGTSVGYVRIPDLASDGVAGAVRQAVTRLQRQGAEAIVVDLRGNPGGRLVTMMQVAGVFTRGFLWRAVLSWSLPVPYPAIGDPATDLPLYLLVDKGVNSAAEGLAGALQDNGRAVVVGETTAGNVEAVLPFCLRDGSQAWIATGVLAPLLGATWEGRGVEPDVSVPADEALDAALRLVGEDL